MPARDSSLYARRAVLEFLKGQAPLVALVPADRMYPGQRPPTPEWPFIAYGSADTLPFTASCLDGSAISVRLHAFAETTGEGVDTVPGEDLAHDICRALVAALGSDDGVEIDLAGTDCPWPATAHVQWTGTQVIPDNGDGSAWHGIVSLSITVSS